jgi:hypothetical protein
MNQSKTYVSAATILTVIALLSASSSAPEPQIYIHPYKHISVTTYRSMNITNIPVFPDQPPDNQTLTLGEQQSMSIRPVGYGHPAWQNNDMQALVIKAAEAGANVWREAFYVDSDPNNSYYQSVKSSVANAGLKLIVQTLAASVGAMTYQEETNIINDVGTAQDNWVNGWKTIISVMQPYAIMVMNEPTNNGDRNSDPSNGDFNLYRTFCSRCISEWRAVKADLVIIVNNNPFNKLFDSTGYGFAATPLTEANVIYGRHVYYAYDSLYPPSYLPDQQDYWDNKLPEAKIHLEAQMHQTPVNMQLIWRSTAKTTAGAA